MATRWEGGEEVLYPSSGVGGGARRNNMDNMKLDRVLDRVVRHVSELLGLEVDEDLAIRIATRLGIANAPAPRRPRRGLILRTLREAIQERIQEARARYMYYMRLAGEAEDQYSRLELDIALKLVPIGGLGEILDRAEKLLVDATRPDNLRDAYQLLLHAEHVISRFNRIISDAVLVPRSYLYMLKHELESGGVSTLTLLNLYFGTKSMRSLALEASPLAHSEVKISLAPDRLLQVFLPVVGAEAENVYIVMRSNSRNPIAVFEVPSYRMILKGKLYNTGDASISVPARFTVKVGDPVVFSKAVAEGADISLVFQGVNPSILLGGETRLRAEIVDYYKEPRIPAGDSVISVPYEVLSIISRAMPRTAKAHLLILDTSIWVAGGSRLIPVYMVDIPRIGDEAGATWVKPKNVTWLSPGVLRLFRWGIIKMSGLSREEKIVLRLKRATEHDAMEVSIPGRIHIIQYQASLREAYIDYDSIEYTIVGGQGAVLFVLFQKPVILDIADPKTTMFLAEGTHLVRLPGGRMILARTEASREVWRRTGDIQLAPLYSIDQARIMKYLAEHIGGIVLARYRVRSGDQLTSVHGMQATPLPTRELMWVYSALHQYKRVGKEDRVEITSIPIRALQGTKDGFIRITGGTLELHAVPWRTVAGGGRVRVHRFYMDNLPANPPESIVRLGDAWSILVEVNKHDQLVLSVVDDGDAIAIHDRKTTFMLLARLREAER